jgi:hypothetical protein
MKTILNVFFVVVFFVIPGIVRAQLTVQDPTVYGTKPGYIDRTTLVVEPHGAFVEQSLYVWYSDHNQYPGNNNLEIVHRFTLPQGSVINDMWLWIGDTVVKAKMFDTWTARHIYDSIVVHRHDPAFLAKNGNAYELHIYPLVSGQSRKVKLNFITPTSWLGKNGYGELPLSYLQASNSQIKPAQILFREQEDIWGSPSIRELPGLVYKRTLDTAGYVYRDFEVSDISPMTSLSVAFQTVFTDGIYSTAGDRLGDSSYFQIGVDPTSFNATRSDTNAASVVVGIDLSGNYNNSVNLLVPRVEAVLHNALRPKDLFCLTVSGGGSVAHFAPFQHADSTTIDTVLQDFAESALAAKLSKARKPVIVFCDANGQTIWRFPSLDSVAIIESFSDIVSASGSFANADIIASYDHGYETAGLTDANLSMLLPKIDSLFYRGGRFLGYFDHNRPGGEEIETHYINGLTENYEANSVTLFAQPNGNIGSSFPSSVLGNSVNYLTFTDPNTKIDLANSNGDGAVISKRINNGLLVVSGLWSFTDDGALKQTLAVPLLGISQSSWSVQQQQMLKPLLSDIQASVTGDTVQQVILFSNADSLISPADAKTWVTSYLSAMSGQKPVFNTINLLDGSLFTPPFVTDNGVDYYGSGFLSNLLSQATGGEHFESHLTSWDVIAEELKYSSYARLDSLTVGVVVDGGAGSLIDMREVAPDPNDRVRPRFFIGVSNAKTKVGFNFQAYFDGLSQTYEKQATAYLYNDTTGGSPVIAGMMGWETLQDYFSESTYDTLKIVNLAIKFNLLCDYTSLIALEPSDQNPPLVNPFDESGLFTYVIRNTDANKDSLSFTAYPNPFNGQIKFYLSLKHSSNIKVSIYNILGQEVRTFRLSASPGLTSVSWDGTGSHGGAAASGVYIVQATVTENSSNVVYRKSLKIMMLK